MQLCMRCTAARECKSCIAEMLSMRSQLQFRSWYCVLRCLHSAGASMVSGVAPRAKVMCLKVQDDDGHLFASYIFAAYQYAVDMGAHIVVNSFSNSYWSVPQNPPGMSTTACHLRVMRTQPTEVTTARGLCITASCPGPHL